MMPGVAGAASRTDLAAGPITETTSITDPVLITFILLPFGGGMYAALALDAMVERIARRMVRRHMRIVAGDPVARANIERLDMTNQPDPTEVARIRNPRLETEAYPAKEVRPCSNT
jgi:hypothetical protein